MSKWLVLPTDDDKGNRTWLVKRDNFMVECTTEEIKDLFKQLELHESFDWKCPF